MTEAERIEENVKKVDAILEQYFEDDMKEKVVAMVEEVADRFFAAPAATRTEYHGCYIGALVEHSLAVTRRMWKLRTAYDMQEEISDQSIMLTGLFHDLGKIGNRQGDSLYIPETSQWHINKGMLYKYNNLNDGLTHAQRSIRLLGLFGIPLTDDEYLAILGHDGNYVEENRTREMMYCKDNKLVRILHEADAWTAMIEKI